MLEIPESYTSGKRINNTIVAEQGERHREGSVRNPGGYKTYLSKNTAFTLCEVRI